MSNSIQLLPRRSGIQAVGRAVNALISALNPLLNIDIDYGDGFGVQYTAGNVKITIPRPASDSGGGGDALGPVQFAGTSGGEPWYYLVNANTGQDTPYAGYTLVNPD